jgi:predicted transcriptional regulator
VTETTNIYRHARMAASVKTPRLSSMDRASEELYISAKSLSDYETGRSTPPCDVVARMREVYGDYELAGQHIRAVCPLLQDYGSPEPSELARAALGWALVIGDAKEIARNFAAVARDGRVTPEEQMAARTIRGKAVEIEQAMRETITAIDKALREAGLQ